MTLHCILLKTPWGYIDLFGTWEGWTLIWAVVLAPAVLAWMEWGKVRCWCGNGIVNYCDTKGEWNAEKCRDCHGSSRVRRAWISRMWRRE